MTRPQLDEEGFRDGYGHLRSISLAEPLLKGYPMSPQSPPLLASRPRSLLLNARLKRVFIVAFASLSAATLIIFASISLLTASPHAAQSVAEHGVPAADVGTWLDTPAPDHEVHDNVADDTSHKYSPYVLGPPTQRFRDNLRNDTQYITSWISAGWTNDVMTYANLIYLGVITSRVPIVAMFTPSHIGGDAATIAFGDVFDVPRFIRDSGIDIVEWREVKDPASTDVDDIGCWNIWESVQYDEHFPRRSTVLDWLKLDISYTRAPEWVKLVPNYEHDRHSTFWTLARLGFPEERAKNLVDPLPSPQHQAVLPPDEHVLCYDYLYYVCAQQPFEFEFDYSPAWRFVGQHLRWTQDIQDLTALYIRRAFSLEPEDDVPPYIAVHVRHGDFGAWCWGIEDVMNDCFAPISAIARRVREVQEELLERKGISIPDARVVVTSDEADPAWWDEIAAHGWVKIDHDAWQTAQTYGRWYPVILDAAIQSTAIGFVGTDRSTYSTLSRRRVESWHDGATRIARWGFKDADAH
ncbi:hypothetical protein WOLCODRAFT_61728 [Wolfiporia cocos MD-104 SS10]|uniref:Uncharacterized protein n=1 Tax=Wolfiporia cocos (strain MD-104) TaxID=742152 RepID=A0A2H3IVF5_WOLCO|nr:hypothetical protein WOLCODRAFT_61728 [Wolfiporia cocos MD-104 SS10]